MHPLVKSFFVNLTLATPRILSHPGDWTWLALCWDMCFDFVKCLKKIALRSNCFWVYVFAIEMGWPAQLNCKCLVFTSDNTWSRPTWEWNSTTVCLKMSLLPRATAKKASTLTIWKSSLEELIHHLRGISIVGECQQNLAFIFYANRYKAQIISPFLNALHLPTSAQWFTC